MSRITRDDLRTLLDAGQLTLVEALPAAAYEAEHIPGAVNVPGELTADIAAQVAPDRAGTVVVYCSGPSGTTPVCPWTAPGPGRRSGDA